MIDAVAAERFGFALVAVGVVLWLVLLVRLVRWPAGRARRRPALVVKSPRHRRPPPPFVPQVEDPTTRMPRLSDRTEAFPSPWGVPRG